MLKRLQSVRSSPLAQRKLLGLRFCFYPVAGAEVWLSSIFQETFGADLRLEG